MNWNRWFRKLHRWGSILIALPLLLVIATGLVLQVKKQFTWIQPSTAKGSPGELTISFEQVLAVARSRPEAAIESWDDVDRLDVRPGKGVIKIRSGRKAWELQLDARTGEVLQSLPRRSDWIEQLHDGSWFHDAAKLWIFLPNGLVLLGLWLTGIYLWWLPIGQKRRNRLARQARTNTTTPTRESEPHQTDASHRDGN